MKSYLLKIGASWFFKTGFRKIIFFLSMFLLLCKTDLQAQLCGGKSGIPVLLETFGAGTAVFGAPLGPGVTNYPYIADWPPDGKYTISNTSNPNNGGGTNWFTEGDHTGNPNGYMMVLNSDMTTSKSELYRQRITGLCPFTNYTFAAWLANVNAPQVLNACNPYAYGNILFELVDPATQAILDSASTGNLPISAIGRIDWKQYGKTINTGLLTSVDVVMINTFKGGCGNDVLIDDISFAVCGPKVNIVANPAKPAYCIGDPLSLNGTLAAGYVNPAFQWQFSTDNNITWNNLPGQTKKDLVFSALTFADQGSYRLLAAEVGNIGSVKCGIVSDTLLIKVVPIPKFTVNSPAICAGQTAVLTATIDPLTAPASFTWDNGGTGASINVIPPANPNPALYKATATRTDGSGCTSSVLSSVTINPAPVISVNPASICLNDKVTLSPSGTADTYSWSPAAGLSATNQSQVDANPAVTTTYQLKASFNTGCSTIVPVVVTVNNPPNITAPDVEVCENVVAVLKASGNASTYKWSPATGLNATTTAQVSASQLPVGVTTYTLTGYSNVSCQSIIQVKVTVNKNPLVSINPVNPVCNGSQASISATVSPVQTASYAWTAAPADASMSSTTTASFTASPGSDTKYTVLVTDAKTCTNSASVTVQVNTPSITVKLHPPVCAGDTAELRAYGASNYSWSPAVTLKKPDGSVVFDAPATPTTYTVTGSIPGCINIASKTVTVAVNPRPDVSSSDQAYCPGGSATLVASGNASNVVWAPATGLSSTTGTSVTATPATNMVYKLTGYSVNGCSSSVNVKVSIYPVPTVTIGPVGPICSGKTIGLTATSNDPNAVFKWTPTPADASMSSSTGSSIVVGPLVNTNYLVAATNTNNCSSSSNQTLTVIEPQLFVNPHKPICIGDTAQLSAYGADSYVWSQGSTLGSTTGAMVVASPATIGINRYQIDALFKGCPIFKSIPILVNPKPVVNIVNPTNTCVGTPVSLTASGADSYTWAADASLNSTVGNTVQAKPLIPRTYTYTVTGTDLNGCINTNSTSLIANGLPVPVIIPPPPICLGATVPLSVNNSIPNIATTFLWDAAPGLNTTKGASVIAKPAALQTTYFVTATDANNCTARTSVPLTAVSKVVPQISDSTRICKGDQVKLTAGGGTSYHWKNIEANTPSINVSPVLSTQYEVVISNGVCMDSARVTVYVKNPVPAKIFIPNAFTPNEDGLNDKFKATSSGVVTNFKGAIFNRWGEIIFEWSDVLEGWDGYYKGVLAQLDVYVYKINVRMECETKTGNNYVGTVTIVR